MDGFVVSGVNMAGTGALFASASARASSANHKKALFYSRINRPAVPVFFKFRSHRAPEYPFHNREHRHIPPSGPYLHSETFRRDSKGAMQLNPAFPAVDPIPLPAPIWLLKLLHIVTLALHFVAVEMLLGGLLLAVLLSLFRRSPASTVTARALARRLTVVMTFVINLGVPPLLFAQVLYGRALYTSSVLIGLYWISIIGLLMLTYWLLYRFSARLEAGRSAWWVGLIAWLLAGSIARLLSTNMTLMLRPEVWRQMYSASSAGRFLPTGDPTLEPRWLLMMAGGLFIGGLWMVYLAARSTFTAEEKRFVAGIGGKVATVFGIFYLAAGLWAARVQPEAVKAGLSHSSSLQICRFRRLRLAGPGRGCRSPRRSRRIRQNRLRLARAGPPFSSQCSRRSCSPSTVTAFAI